MHIAECSMDRDLMYSLLHDALRERKFNERLDRYLTKGKLSPDEYWDCTKAQRIVLQCIKRSFARLEK